MDFVSSFLLLIAFQLGGAGPPCYAYGYMITVQVCSHTNYINLQNQPAKKHLP